ncbi:MAG: hypothetical protein JXR94_00675, partial [Candidatus Hydrogenedentes bacterium]|nr:hypothetical protein [Candidatus Hydrogenedentota bacterium]
PQLDLDQGPARRAGAYARAERKTGVLGNGFLEARIDFAAGRAMQSVLLNKLTGECHDLDFSPFELTFDDVAASGHDIQFSRIEAGGSADVASLSAHASFGWFDAQLSYVLNRGEHFIRKLVYLHHFDRSAYLRRVSLLKHQVSPDYEVLVHDAGMYYPVVFVRSKKGSLFFAVDFVGCFSTADAHSFSLDYYPGKSVEPGDRLRLLGVLIGICTLSGRLRANPYHESAAQLDVGEQQWFRAALLEGPQSPLLPYLELKARDTGVPGPGELDTLRQCQWFGAQHVFLPCILRAPGSCPLGDAVKNRLAEQRVRAGLVLSRDVSGNLRWVAMGENGEPATPDYGACFACNEFRDYLVERYLALMDEHGFRNIEFSGSPITPCFNPGHGHATGVESLHSAFQGLVEVAAALREDGGHVSCAGPYGSYGAGVVHISDTISGIARPHPLPLPDIHPARLFADMGRLYFRRSHSFLVPRPMLSNSIGIDPDSCPDAPYPGAEHYPWHLYHDSAGWRYALISALATGLHHRMFALPPDLSDADRAFAKEWFDWERKRMLHFEHVEEVLDEPGLGAVDGYSYTTGRGAIVFLFNCTYDQQDAELNLHLDHDADYVVRELYPRQYNSLGPNDGLYRRDSAIHVALQPREARVIEAVRRSPAWAKRRRPEVFGAESDWSAAAGGPEQLTVYGAPGDRIAVGVRTRGRFSAHDIRFPGTPTPRHITEWAVTQRRLEDGVAALSQGAFPGKPWTPQMAPCRNAWLCAKVHVPEDVGGHIDRTPFTLARPCWTYPGRIFFVIRFEPEPAFDPIRTSSGVPGIPEGYQGAMPIKCGIDLAPLNIALHAWVNGEPCQVYPALAAWDGFAPNPHPVVAFFFEAGSKLKFGFRNRIVLFATNFNAPAFRGVYIEHLPDIRAEKVLQLQ